jgi:hypothetical protein
MDDLICMCSEWVPETVSTLLLHSCQEAFHKGGICLARPLSRLLARAALEAVKFNININFV